MIKITSTVKSLPPSGIRAFFDLVLSMDDVVSLGVGEPDFPTPWHISQYAIEKIEAGYTSYASNSGLLELRTTLSAFIQQQHGVRYDSENEILITVGVSEAVDLAMRAILEPEDEVLVVEPSYVSYKPVVTLAGGTPRVITTYKENEFKLTAEALSQAINKKTKALLLNYPCNPTGTTYTKEELDKLLSVVKKNDLLVISDEIYDLLSFDHPHTSLISFPGFKDRVLYLNGFSKGYAMTGWRVGYAAGPAPLIEAMTKIHQYTIMCVPIMGQFAALEAIRSGADAVNKMKQEYKRRRNYVVQRLNAMGMPCHTPGGAFYVFPEIPDSFQSSEVYARELLQAEKVAVVPGNAFGACERHIRISYASSMQKLKKAMDAMEQFASKK